MSNEIKTLYDEAVYALEHWDLDKAESILKQLLQIEPEHGESYNKLGVVYARRDDLITAETYFQEALRFNPNLAGAYSNLGNIYQHRGWTDRAISAYEKAIQLDPDYPPAHHNLGVLYKKIGKVGEGVELLKKAAKLEKGRMRAVVQSSPQKRRMVSITWIVIAIILGYLLFRR